MLRNVLLRRSLASGFVCLYVFLFFFSQITHCKYHDFSPYFSKFGKENKERIFHEANADAKDCQVCFFNETHVFYLSGIFSIPQYSVNEETKRSVARYAFFVASLIINARLRGPPFPNP
ncbi:MAG: hypothetical protein FDW93_03645 [Bergeyella sp.]|nr:hypothetical protein [Bergeyella sp.]